MIVAPACALRSTRDMRNDTTRSRTIVDDPAFDLKTIGASTRTSVSFYRKAIARRELACIRIGRSVRIRASELERFLASRERPAGARR